MKRNFKKAGALTLGMVCGMAFGTSAFAANDTNVGAQPYLYQGRTASGRGTGRFNSIQQVGMEILRFMEVIVVPLIMSLALVAFLFGILQMIRKGDEPQAREQGRQFMIWGVVGLAVMASVWGLVRIITNTLGVPLGIPTVNDID